MDTAQGIMTLTAILAGVAFSFYAILKKERTASSYALALSLLFASAVTAFDALSAYDPANLRFWKTLSLFSEAGLPPSWLLFSMTFSRNVDLKSVSASNYIFLALSSAFLVSAAALPIEAFFYSPDFDHEKILFLEWAGFAFYTGILFYMVIAAYNIEMTLRTAHKTEKWKIKYEILGAGIIVAYMIFHYSQALLYRVIIMDLPGIRSLIFLMAIGLMAYSKVRRGNGVKVFVSKDMAYRSVVIVMVGLYLIILGLMGEGLRHFGRTTQHIFLLLAAFLGGTGLLIALLSETVKRKIKVFLHKNFYTNKFDYRAQWLQFTERLSTSKSRDEVLRAILSGFAETFGMKGAALFLPGNVGDYVMASDFETYMEGAEIGKASGIVAYMDSKKWVLNCRDSMPETGEAERVLLEKNDIAFVVPLFFDGAVGGFIVLKSPMNRDEIYTYEDYDLMKTLSRQAASTILNLRLSEELAGAREMEAIGRVSAFVAHDLKNHVSTISLLAENAYGNIDDPEFQKDMVETLRNTASKMKTLISRLKDMKEKGSLDIQSADLYALSAETVRTINREVALEGCGVLVEADREEVQKVILNLVLNAIEASGTGARVRVEVGSSGESAFVKVSDNGCGMTEEFMRTRLFKPFSTTKKKGLGIGLYQCKQVIEAHGGSIEVQSAPGKGSAFTVNLPLAKKQGFVMNLEGAGSYGKASGNRR